MITYGLIILILFLLSIYEEKYKKINRSILLIILLIFMYIIIAYNNWTPDLENYKKSFYNIGGSLNFSRREPIFILIVNIVKYVNGNFEDFQKLYALLLVVLFYRGILKKTKSKLYILLIYFILPFFPNIVQLRQFLSFLIFNVGFQSHNKKTNYLCTTLAFLTHYSIGIFFIYLLLENNKYFNKLRYFFIFLVLEGIAFFIFQNYTLKIFKIQELHKYSEYIYKANTKFLGTLYLILPFIAIMLLMVYIDFKNKNIYNEKIIQFTKFMLLCYPLIFFIRDLLRMYYNFYPFIAIYFCNIFYKNLRKQIFFKFIFIFLTIFIFYWEFLLINRGEYFTIIYNSIFENRLF